MALASFRSAFLLSPPLVAAVSLLAASAAPAQAPPAAPAGPPAEVARSGDRVSVSGYVTAATVEAVGKELSSPGAKIDTLAIQSTGADIDPLLELGRLVHRRKMTVQVNGICAGTCATFLPPAAERLVVPEGSFLVFFPMLSSQKALVAQASGTAGEQGIRDALERQASYFRDLEVDPDAAYAIGEAALVVSAALSAAGRQDQPLVVADAAYLRGCLGIGSVDVPAYTVADSARLAHVSQRTPISFLIGGKIYYEGKEVASFAPPCTG